MFLKQSTAFTDRIGPFLDKTDGVTEEVGLTTAAAAIFLSAAGGNFVAKNESTALAHDQDGWYVIVYDATDTATVGLLKVQIQAPATHLPVWVTYYVLEEAIYDALFAGSANAFNGAAGSSAVGLVDLVTTTTTNTDMVGTDNAALASLFTGITSVAEWLGALMGKQAADSTALTEIKATGAGSGTFSELTDSLEAIQSIGIAAVSGAVGSVTGAVGSVTGAVGSVTGAIGQMTGITQLAEWLGIIAGKQAGDATALIEIKATGAGSGTYDEGTDSQEAIRDTAPLGTVMRGTDSALTDKAGFALSATGADLILKDSIFALALADAVADEVYTAATHNVPDSLARRIRLISNGRTEGTVSDVSPTTGGFDTDLTEEDRFWNDALFVFDGGVLDGQARTIDSYLNAGGAVAFDEVWTSAPSNGDAFIIKSDHIHPVTQIAAAVLDKLLSAHTDAGSLGKAVADIETVLAGITSLKEWLGALAGKQVADATAQAEIRTSGAGSGAYDATTDSQEAIKDVAPHGSTMVGTDGAATETKQDTMQGNVTVIQAKTDNLAGGIKKNVARSFSFFMADDTDGRTPKTGLTVAVQLSKDQGAFTNATNTPATEVSNGDYEILLTQAEMNFDEIVLKATATDADQTLLGIHTSDN